MSYGYIPLNPTYYMLGGSEVDTQLWLYSANYLLT